MCEMNTSSSHPKILIHVTGQVVPPHLLGSAEPRFPPPSHTSVSITPPPERVTPSKPNRQSEELT